MLYYPFFDENDLTLNGGYVSKLNSPVVRDLTNKIFEPAFDIVDNYWVQLQNQVEIKDHFTFYYHRRAFYFRKTGNKFSGAWE